MRCAVCSLDLPLLASPDSAGGGLGRAGTASRRDPLFSLQSLLFFDPTPQVLPPHCHSCNIRVKILSAVYCTSVFSVLTHERVVV